MKVSGRVTGKNQISKKKLIVLITVIVLLIATVLTVTLTLLLPDKDDNKRPQLTEYKVTGKVSFDGVGLAGVTIVYGSNFAQTNALGEIKLSVFSPVTLSFQKEGFEFSPQSVEIKDKETRLSVTATIISNPPLATKVISFVDGDGKAIDATFDFSVGSKTYTYLRGTVGGMTLPISVGDQITIIENDYVEGNSYRILSLDGNKIIVALTYKPTIATLKVVDKNGNPIPGIDVFDINDEQLGMTNDDGILELAIDNASITVYLEDAQVKYSFDESYIVYKQATVLDAGNKTTMVTANYLNKIGKTSFSFVKEDGTPLPLNRKMHIFTLSQADDDEYVGPGFTAFTKKGSYNYYSFLLKSDTTFSIRSNFAEKLTGYYIDGTRGYYFVAYPSAQSGRIVCHEGEVFNATLAPNSANDMNNQEVVYSSKLGNVFAVDYDDQGAGTLSTVLMDDDTLFTNMVLLKEVEGQYLYASESELDLSTTLSLQYAKAKTYNVRLNLNEENEGMPIDSLLNGSAFVLKNEKGEIYRGIIEFDVEAMSGLSVEITTLTMYKNANTDFVVGECSIDGVTIESISVTDSTINVYVRF